MGRLPVVLLLVVALVLPGCGTSRQVVHQRPEAGPPVEARPELTASASSPVLQYLKDHHIATKVGIALLVVGAAALVGAGLHGAAIAGFSYN
jgi:hypothetical protein